ncbi:MAG: T9SS type A sorting domain-containing protein [Chryseobacterium sp.]|uniref:T9SS type A sorting domain-containing protein n=1 Tax=Chryseobacterium sp. TaxID=1871047 RepID=UPI0025BB2266|nr:T9SS type A sorting domain-containing protein [Chryseobacterium sp.]MCJ7933173.1 T9SS type A sorting domain-containing protein [Chryseobacterium sp.]
MKRIYILWSMIPMGLAAQNFTEIQTGMNNFYYSAADIADMDQNGTPDIVLNGALDSDGDGNVDTTYNEVYKNNGGSLSLYADLGTDVTHLGDIRFIDYNNDGLQDIISTGLSYMDIVNYKQYRFKNTGTGFVKEDELQGKIYGSMEVFDFNHDGKPDYALNGTQYFHGAGFRNTLDFYRNTGAGFDMTENWVDGTQNGSFKLVDLNNDQLLDLVIIGSDIAGSAVGKVYMNIAGTLMHTQDLMPLTSGKLEFADFNADGFQDIVVAGKDENDDGYFAVLMNNGTGVLTAHQMNVPDISDASISVGDLNNDGYYDFIIAGNENYDGMVKTYLYNVNGQDFTEGTLAGVQSLGGPGLVHVFDFDNDHHPDILLSGFDWSDPNMPSLTKIFKNTATEENLKPTPPANLTLTKNGNRFNFTWSGATDDKTPVNALRYEISVGSTPGAADIAKYMVTTPSWFLELDPSVQHVYWSVRSMDAAKVYSNPSSESSTLATRDIPVKNELAIYPNPASDKVYIKGEKVSEAELYSMDGRKLNVILNGDQSIDVSHLPKGIYLLKLKIKNEVTTKKLSIK